MFLAMAGRQGLMVGLKLAAAEQAIEELLTAVRRLPTGDHINPSHDETDFTARK